MHLQQRLINIFCNGPLWSACLPSNPTIHIRILQFFSGQFMFKKNENKQKEAGVGPFYEKEFSVNEGKIVGSWIYVRHKRSSLVEKEQEQYRPSFHTNFQRFGLIRFLVPLPHKSYTIKKQLNGETRSLFRLISFFFQLHVKLQTSMELKLVSIEYQAIILTTKPFPPRTM